jgi:hypothetical protein
MSEYVLTLLLPEQVRAQWTTIEPLLKPAEQHCGGEVLVEDVPKLVDDRAAFVLALYEDEEMILAGVLEVLRLPRKTVLNVMFMGGRNFGKVVEHFMQELKHIGDAVGATALRGYCHPAMAKFLQRTQPNTRVIYYVTEADL